MLQWQHFCTLACLSKHILRSAVAQAKLLVDDFMNSLWTESLRSGSQAGRSPADKRDKTGLVLVSYTYHHVPFLRNGQSLTWVGQKSFAACISRWWVEKWKGLTYLAACIQHTVCVRTLYTLCRRTKAVKLVFSRILRPWCMDGHRSPMIWSCTGAGFSNYKCVHTCVICQSSLQLDLPEIWPAFKHT